MKKQKSIRLEIFFFDYILKLNDTNLYLLLEKINTTSIAYKNFKHSQVCFNLKLHLYSKRQKMFKYLINATIRKVNYCK